MNVVVYLGASLGNNNKFIDECKKLGKIIAKTNSKLVYGGSKSGLMGIIADSVIDNGGYVIGVEPKMFIDKCFQHERINELIITNDMQERKTKMIELGDIFVAFPGGTGTLDEITEALELTTLSDINGFKKECIFYNIDGYYDDIKSLFKKMIDNEYTNHDRLKYIHFLNNENEIEEFINKKGCE